MTSDKENTNLKTSLKATTLFGGVQIIGIIVSVIKNKLVALLIGPVGVGIVELYNSTIRLIKSFTDFSIEVSAVREVSISYKTGDKAQFNHKVGVFSRIVWLTGLLGLLVCLLGSPLWSKMTFGDYEHTLAFAILSVVLLLEQLRSGKTVILQGTGQYRSMALSGVFGSILGLVTTVPIYYFMGLDGIVAVLVITIASSYLIAYYYASRVKVEKVSLTFNQTIQEGKGMLSQGILISINYLLSSLIFYVLRIFITDKGGAAELGLYAASFVIVTTYLGMVFQSVSKEYFPRISALSKDNVKFCEAINDQIYLILLILGPLVAVFLVFSDQLLMLLYSDKFTGASLMMALCMVGVIYQAPSWCMGYAFLAKGDNKAFILFETIAKTQRIITDIVFYLLWGLTGIGVSFIVSYIYYSIQSIIVCKKRYGLSMSRTIYSILAVYFIISMVLIACFVLLSPLHRIIVGFVFIILISLFSYNKLNAIVDIKGFIRNKFIKHK